MLDLWKAFLNLLQLCDKIYEDPWNTMKSLKAEKETAPEEYRPFYDALIMLCRLKIIADSRNITVIELVDEIVRDYINRVWGDMYGGSHGQKGTEKGNQ